MRLPIQCERTVLYQFCSQERTSDKRAIDLADGVQTDKVLAQVLDDGIRRLRKRCIASALQIMTDSAWRSLERNLLWRLSTALDPTLRVVHKGWRLAMTGGMSDEAGRRTSGFSCFFLADAFKHFPDAAELADNIVSDWVNAQSETLRRLVQDTKRIQTLTCKGAATDPVLFVELDRSDPHERSRTVTIFTFRSGFRVVYKPRSSAGERIWFGVLDWLNRSEFGVHFQIPPILQGDHYFWMTYVCPKRCLDTEALKRFYFRWGAQTAVAQFLEFEDLHRDNWIAAGEDPVLVDAEMIQQPNPESPLFSKRWAALPALLRTGLVTIRKRDGAGSYAETAPLDDKSAIGMCDFLPRIGGTPVLPSRFVSSIVEGYRATLKFITSTKRRLDFFQKILQIKKQEKHRILYRATAEYYILLRNSYSPRYTAQYGSRRQYLFRACSKRKVPPWALEWEIEELFRGSIPRFTGLPSSTRRTGSFRRIDSSQLLYARVVTRKLTVRTRCPRASQSV